MSKYQIGGKVMCTLDHEPVLTKYKVYDVICVSAEEPYFIYINDDTGEESGWKPWIFEEVVEIK